MGDIKVKMMWEYLEKVVPDYKVMTSDVILSRCQAGPRFVYAGQDGECHKVVSFSCRYYVLNSTVGRKLEEKDGGYWYAHISKALKKWDYVVFQRKDANSGNVGYPLVKDEELRQKIIATAWPMCAA